MSECPKCGEPRPAGERAACRRCGLRLDRWDAFDDAPRPDPVLDRAFDALAPRWQEPAAHEAFLSLAQAHGTLDGAAARYRRALRKDPADAAGRAALDKVVLLAAHQQAVAPRDSLRAFRIAYYVAVALAAAFVVAVAAVVARYASLRRG